mmetsp:Transcript_13160/g.28493  ORF Transcript_13160/g.28493 Transcript_13160/m.28493 type:complete len:207 (+) Transcript_13160:26-646(+)
MGNTCSGAADLGTVSDSDEERVTSTWAVRRPQPVKRRVGVAATCIGTVAGIGAFHTSVLLGNEEYFFESSGIICGPRLQSHAIPHAGGEIPETEVVDCGVTLHSGFDLMRRLSPYFGAYSYDLIHKNCNSFTDVALWYLLGERLDSRFTRLDRFMKNGAPLTTAIMNQVLKAYVGQRGIQCTSDVYVRNKNAADFDLEAVIADLVE